MSDRHFDELATRFAEKIYGGAKGAIRLAVLQADLAEALPQRPLRVLDIGAGLGHMSLWLAQQGHAVTLAEPAEPMLEGARERFTSAGQSATFLQAPWQEVENHVEGRFDLVICHAVLEWLAEPQAILPVLHRLTAPDGWLSLAFYNRDALIYRNLLKGHFKKLRSQSFAGERQSLTPQRPLDPRELAAQLDPHWRGRIKQWRACIPRLHARRFPGAYRADGTGGDGTGISPPSRFRRPRALSTLVVPATLKPTRRCSCRAALYCHCSV